MNERVLSVFKDCVKFSLFAAIPGLLGGVAYGWWVGFKLWLGFTLVFVVAMMWACRRDLVSFIRRR